jgi:hypothetical protein
MSPSEKSYGEQYREERKLVLDRLNAMYASAVAGSVAYGSVATRSSILLNSSALFLLPVYIRILGDDVFSGSYWIFSIFVLGALSGALSSMFAHNNFNAQIQRNHYENALDSNNAHVRLSGENFEAALKGAEQANKDLQQKFEKYGAQMNRTMYRSFGCAFASYAFFALGCLFVLIELNSEQATETLGMGCG